MATDRANDANSIDPVSRRTDLAGMAFKAVLLALVIGIGYFLVKPLWDDLFRSLPNTPNQQVRDQVSPYDFDGGG